MIIYYILSCRRTLALSTKDKSIICFDWTQGMHKVRKLRSCTSHAVAVITRRVKAERQKGTIVHLKFSLARLQWWHAKANERSHRSQIYLSPVNFHKSAINKLQLFWGHVVLSSCFLSMPYCIMVLQLLVRVSSLVGRAPLYAPVRDTSFALVFCQLYFFSSFRKGHALSK